MIDTIVKALRSWKRLTNAVEALLIDNIAATAPWLAPVIPAYMAWDSMTAKLHFPWWVALAGAGVVELLGLSAVSTTFQFWDWNDSAKRLDPRAPVLPAAITAAFYLVVVLTVNVMLDDAPVMYRVAKALLSSLSISAAIILALRSQHTRRIEAADVAREERKEARKIAKDAESYVSYDWRTLPVEEKQAMRGMSASQIQAAYPGMDRRTALNWETRSR